MLALLLAGTADTPPLGFASCLHWACEMRKELDFCRKVLQAVPRSSSAKDRAGNCALHCILLKGDATPVDMVKLLVEAAPEILQESNLDGCTPLHLALVSSTRPQLTCPSAPGTIFKNTHTCLLDPSNTTRSAYTGTRMRWSERSWNMIYAVNHEDESGRLPIIVACKHNSPSEEVILSLLK